ncbi:uncharacterized protein DNG_06194 [Cephalotrichum gorgonifer]|uniref:Peptidase A1 domain-containing protein n=1 Tax=Cephalotrichum gorgonifer TaxID=2041049 RepID=A0AAE8SW76_9PEZI|nr:uncharacterized protein DNG_06194 [Cephalotrichum gorgonifer]
MRSVSLLLSSLPILPFAAGRGISLPARAPAKQDGKAAYASAMRRWGKRDVSSGLWVGNRLGEETLEAQSHENDAFFTVDIEVGTPGQTLPVILDTGSSDTWVYWAMTDFSDLPGDEKPAYYDPYQSSTARQITDAEWDVQYADGSVASGPVALETISLSNLTLTSATLELANTSSILANSTSGILGLARSLRTSVYPHDVPTIKERIAGAGAHFLNIDLRAGSGGSYSLGDLDDSVEGISWSEGGDEHWTVEVNVFYVEKGEGEGGQAVGNGSAAGFVGVVDTGTSLLFVPGLYVTAYWIGVPSARHDPVLDMWIFPCSGAESLPDVVLEIAGTGKGGAFEAVVPGAYLNFGSIEEGWVGGGVGGGGPAEEMCYGGLQSADGIGVDAVLGDVFIKSQFIVLGLEDGKVGLAKKDLEGDATP